MDVDPPALRDRGLASVPRGLLPLMTAAAAVLVVAGLHAIADIVAPVFLALVLTVAVHPLHGMLRRRGAAPWAALLGTLAAVYLILLGLVGGAALSVARLAALLPTYQDRAQELTDDVRRGLADLGLGGEQISAALGSVELGSVVRKLLDVLSGLVGITADLVLVVTALLFMALDAAGFTARLGTAAAGRTQLAAALGSFARGTRRYLVVSTVFGLIVAVLDTIALALLGIPLPLVWGLLSFITNYIPNIGFVVGLVPPALLGLLEGGPSTMLAVILVYCVINVMIQSVIQPKVVGDVVGLSATVSFLSLIFWTWVIGPLGALLAIPLSVLTKALLLDMDPSTRWLSTLVSGGGTDATVGGSVRPARWRRAGRGSPGDPVRPSPPASERSARR